MARKKRLTTPPAEFGPNARLVGGRWVLDVDGGYEQAAGVPAVEQTGSAWDVDPESPSDLPPME